MLDTLLRIIKRTAILVPGIVIAFFSVREVFPYFDARLPLGFAILVTYVLAAYVIIPAIIRLIRIVWPPKHLPLYCVTPDGFASDPVNIALTGTRREIIQSMQAAGWHMADTHKSLRNLVRHFLSILFDWAYPNAPVSSLYLLGRKQDLAFQKHAEGLGSSSRHHVRFWATTYRENKRLTVRSIDWHHRRDHLYDDDLLWVGAASLDVGLAPIRHNFQITHMINPDTNSERELIIKDLKKAGLVAHTRSIKLGEPYKLINRAFRGHLHTDGRMTLVHLR